MKKTIVNDMKNISLVAIMMAATIFAACSGEEIIISTQSATGTFTLTVNASKGDDADTRVLTLDGTTLKATWKAGDVVTVYNVTRSADLTGSLIAQSDGKSTTLSGTLTGTIAAGDNLKLKFLSPTYSSQDGTLAGIASTCDYAEATVSVTAVSESSITTPSATFENKQSIVEFTLKNMATSADLNATSLTVYAGDNTINVTPSSATNVLYVAIPGISSKTVYLSATVGGINYIYKKTGVTIPNGKFYGYTVKMSEFVLPLTFEAKEPGAIVTFTAGTHATNPIQYSTNGVIWENFSGTITLDHVGDKVYFSGDNDAYGGAPYIETNSHFSCEDGDCYIYGNIMSLINPTDYATATFSDVYTYYYAFAGLFSSNDRIYNHPTKELKLPATTLSTCCYSEMFSGCTNLTTPPELPATTLAYGCYRDMFNGCTGLTAAPALPATTLAGDCYDSMFKGCTSLTTAPMLSVTTLAESCYRYMFSGCTSLTTAPALPATTMAEKCYEWMFSDCTNLITAPTLSATELAESCYGAMFKGCTSLTTAPALPATTLEVSCYSGMFRECTGLTAAPTLPATTLAKSCYQSMFSGCTNLTTAPVLSVTTLAENCYYLMFCDCTSLTTAPALPATMLEKNCYHSMFYGCTSLTTAPTLPATTMFDYCYAWMFRDCTNLIAAPALPATTLAEYCYYDMFCGCTNLTTAPALQATTLKKGCYSGMFSSCYSLNTAPALPATELEDGCYALMFIGCTSLTTAPTLSALTLTKACYDRMFSGCSNLNYVKCLATNISATDCTRDWLSSVSYTGTFTKATSMTSWTTGSSGIPSGWTVLEE